MRLRRINLLTEAQRAAPRSLDEAIARLIELGEFEFGLRNRYPYTAHAARRWQCATLTWQGNIVRSGDGDTPAEAAWALVEAVERG